MTEINADWSPLEAQEHAAQVDAILQLLDGGRKRVVEIGAGDGRVAGPVREAGHDVFAIDSDPAAVEACRSRGVPSAALDACSSSTMFQIDGNRVDAVLCVGNTFMLFDDPQVAAALMRRIRDSLAPDGVFVIDNFPAALWAEVHDGAWCEGVSEDGDMQMVWLEGDNVFALRQGAQVDSENWTIGPADRRHRLWTLGELALLAAGSAFLSPEEDPTGQLLVFRTV